MEKLTIKEIARICGISVSTVSRAINNHYDINPETKRKVQAVIDQYGYVPNNSARNLKISDARNIAVMVKGITNPFFTSMIKVFEQECCNHEYSLVLQHVEDRANEVEVAALIEKEKRLNGIIFLGGSPLDSREKLDRLQAPFVLCSVAVNNAADFDSYSYVAIDDKTESRKITDYLLDSGRKRIAILAAIEEDCSIGTLRLEGYLDSLIAHGIPADPELIVRPLAAENTYTYENGYAGVRKLIEQNIPFDAVYAISDAIALGAMRALHDAGLRIPEDVALCGFDGLEIGKYLMPSLTTMVQPMDMIAMDSIRALFDQINQEDAEPYHKIFSGELRKMESA